MNLKEYDRRMQQVDQWFASARSLSDGGAQLINRTLREAGIEHVRRDPGFPCYRIDGIPGWFHTPREALEAREYAALGGKQQ